MNRRDFIKGSLAALASAGLWPGISGPVFRKTRRLDYGHMLVWNGESWWVNMEWETIKAMPLIRRVGDNKWHPEDLYEGDIGVLKL